MAHLHDESDEAHPFILVADDDDDDRMITLMALRKSFPGITPIVAREIDDVVSHLNSDLRFDLVLLDLKMPRGGAMRVLRECGPWGESTLVYVFSSSCDPTDVAAVRAAGAHGFVQKPLEFDPYRQMVERIVQDRPKSWFEWCE